MEKCNYPACEHEADDKVWINGTIKYYCAGHSSDAVDEAYGSPEYIVDCPCCGVRFGVN